MKRGEIACLLVTIVYPEGLELMPNELEANGRRYLHKAKQSKAKQSMRVHR